MPREFVYVDGDVLSGLRVQEKIDKIVRKEKIREALSAAGYRASEEELLHFVRESDDREEE